MRNVSHGPKALIAAGIGVASLVVAPHAPSFTTEQNPDIALSQRNANISSSDIISLHDVSRLEVRAVPWSLDRIDQADPELDGRYETPYGGKDVHAYVIDSGINLTHDEFEGRIGEGVSFVDEDSLSDCSGHGTAVAGALGGTTLGVARDVTLHPVRVKGCEDGPTQTSQALIKGINWVAANAIKPAVANISLGVETPNAEIDEAVSNLVDSGVTVVLAASNEGLDACTHSPARVPEAITVGASDENDNRAWFSDYGECIDIFAPGTNVTTTGIASDTASVTASGTSFATPYVAGAAAIILSVFPDATPEDVAVLLHGSATRDALTVNRTDWQESQSGPTPNVLLKVSWQ